MPSVFSWPAFSNVWSIAVIYNPVAVIHGSANFLSAKSAPTISGTLLSLIQTFGASQGQHTFVGPHLGLTVPLRYRYLLAPERLRSDGLFQF